MQGQTHVVVLKSLSEPRRGQWNSFSFVQRGHPKNDNTKVTLGLARYACDPVQLLIFDHIHHSAPPLPQVIVSSQKRFQMKVWRTRFGIGTVHPKRS